MFRFLCLALMLPPALTLAAPLTAQELNCANPTSQVEYTGCAARAYEAADEDLNLAYRLAIDWARRMDAGMTWTPTTEEMLRDAQRAWIPFRDAACAAESTQMRGGTGQNMVYYTCLERLTRARTEDLRLLGEEN